MTLNEYARTLAPDELGPDTIPIARYTSREYLGLERLRLWPRVWQVACLVDELQRPGDYAEYRIHDTSIVVLRTNTGRITAYYNSCLHRGTKLVSGCGNTPEFRCPYHAWRWNLDGESIDVVDAHDFRAELVDPAALTLPSPLVDTWGGFVWVNMDPDAVPLLQWLSPAAEILARWELDKMSLVMWQQTRVAANWKTVVDAFNESYHIQGAHSQLLPYLDDTALEYAQYPSGHSWMGDRTGSAQGQPSKRILNGDLLAPDALLAVVADMVSNRLMAAETLTVVEEYLAAGGDATSDQALKLLSDMKRKAFSERGIDMSHLSDAEMIGNDDFNLWPNVVGPVLAGSAYIFRMLPDGDDPNSSLLDVWRFERLADGEQGITSPEWVEDSLTYTEWGSIQEQDMHNLPLIQSGMRTSTEGFIRLGRQEGNLRNFHRMLDEYIEV